VEVIKETVVKVVVKEVPVKEQIVVKEIVKEKPVVYRTVNHYYTEHNREVRYYQLPDEPKIQPVNYRYYEPVETEKEVRQKYRPARKSERKPKVRMFLVDGIREPLYGKEDYND
jgi:hypothetical protein